MHHNFDEQLWKDELLMCLPSVQSTTDALCDKQSEWSWIFFCFLFYFDSVISLCVSVFYILFLFSRLFCGSLISTAVSRYQSSPWLFSPVFPFSPFGFVALPSWCFQVCCFLSALPCLFPLLCLLFLVSIIFFISLVLCCVFFCLFFNFKQFLFSLFTVVCILGLDLSPPPTHCHTEGKAEGISPKVTHNRCWSIGIGRGTGRMK